MAGRKGAGGKKGRSGRRPLPREVKEARGTLRPSREAKATAGQPAVEFPPARLEAPYWLGEEARQEWNRLVPVLDAGRVLTAGDVTLLAGLCTATEQLIHATKEGNRKEAREALGVVLRYSVEFGLSPAARTRVAAGLLPVAPSAPAERPVDEAEAFIFKNPTVIAGGRS